MCAEASVFEDFGDLRANSSGEEEDATSDFAAKRVVKGVVVWALRAVKRFVAALCGSNNAVAETHSTASLELPVIKVQSCLLRWCSPAKTITNAPAGEEPGLFRWG